jgi:hypothetical protein
MNFGRRLPHFVAVTDPVGRLRSDRGLKLDTHARAFSPFPFRFGCLGSLVVRMRQLVIICTASQQCSHHAHRILSLKSTSGEKSRD